MAIVIFLQLHFGSILSDNSDQKATRADQKNILPRRDLYNTDIPYPICNNAVGYQPSNPPTAVLRGKSYSQVAENLRYLKKDPLCLENICSEHSFCFLGSCMCHPGYDGSECSKKMLLANHWYTDNCPNLMSENTADISVPLRAVGGEHTYAYSLLMMKDSKGMDDSRDSSTESRNKTNSSSNSSGRALESVMFFGDGHAKCVRPARPDTCAYLCYSHPTYGTAVVPISLWQAAQKAEG